VAQKAATMQILSGGRFRLGLGSGENLNKHVVGMDWPAVGTRHEIFSKAVDIISGLFDAPESFNFRGKHYNVDSARLWDLPETRVPIGIAVSGRDSCRLAGEKGDIMIATGPLPELGEMFDEFGGSGKPRVGQIAVAYDPDRDRAVERAHDQFRWFGLGWRVNADLPGPPSFEVATSFVTPEQVGEQLPCGPDVYEHVEKIKPFLDASFDEIALVQIGADQQEPFFEWAEKELLPALHEL
jgi:G6PDH family F420-dependent oxidoreductase